MKKILSVFLFTILAVSVTHAEGLVYTSGTGGPYKPTFTFSNTLRFNTKSNDVVELQKTLISKGYLKADATGYFGKLTFAAVKAFQKDKKIKSDGVVGKDTKKLLIQEIGTPVSDGVPQVNIPPTTGGITTSLGQQTTTTACTSTTTPSITILNPIAGTSYTPGQQVTIQWTSCNVNNVYLGWSVGGHDLGNFIDASLPATPGSYQWTVPNVSNLGYGNTGFRIGIESQSPNVLKLSSPFSIQ